MCKSEPQTPVASTRTTASSAAIGSGSGRSSTRTSPGPWKVTARMAGDPTCEDRAGMPEDRPPKPDDRPAMPEAFFLLDGGRYAPTVLTRGPWDPGAQHAGPPAALLGRELERCEPSEGTHLGRVTFEILRPVPLEPLEVDARVVRPGRSVELLDALL